MEIKFDARNELLKRREVQFVLNSEKNPGFENCAKMLAEKFGVGEENVSVKAVRSNFGAQQFLVEAFVYDSHEGKKKIEPKQKAKKTAGGK